MSLRSLKMPTLPKLKVIKSVGRKHSIYVTHFWMNSPCWKQEGNFSPLLPSHLRCLLSISEAWKMSLSFHCHFQGLEQSHFLSFKCPDPLCLSFKSQLPTAQAWYGIGNTRQLWEGWWRWTGERSYLCDFIIWYLSGSDPIVTALVGSSGKQTAGGIWHCRSPQRKQWWEEHWISPQGKDRRTWRRWGPGCALQAKLWWLVGNKKEPEKDRVLLS